MNKKKTGMFILSLFLLFFFGYSFFSLPRENYEFGDSKYSPKNVIVEIKGIKVGYHIDYENNEIIFPIGYDCQKEYNVLLPSNLISENIENIAEAGFIYDKEGKAYLFFSYANLNEDKFIIKDAKVIPDFNHPKQAGIVEIRKIKKIGKTEENLFICEIALGISFCIVLAITILLFPEMRYT